MYDLIKSLARGGALAFGGRIFSAILGFTATVMLARSLGPELFGLYALGLAITTISAKISLLGMQNGILRFFPILKDSPGQAKGLLLISIILPGSFSIFLIAMYYLTSNYVGLHIFHKPEMKYVIWIFSLSLPFLVLSEIAASVFRSERNIFLYLMLKEIIRKSIFIILIIVSIVLGFKLYGVLIIFVVSAIISLIIGAILFTKNFSIWLKNINSEYRVKEILSFSMPSFMIGISYILLTQIDRIMIGIFDTSSAVGIYSVCARTAIFMNIILASFNTIFVPYISRLYYHDKKEELSLMYKYATKWTTLLSMPLFVFFLIMAKYILTIFGTAYTFGYLPFIILSFFYLLNSISGSNGFVLQMVGKQYVELYNCLGVLTMNIILNLLLIPKFGITGAAVATGISLLLINLIRILEIYLFIQIHPFSKSYAYLNLSFVFGLLCVFIVGRILPLSTFNQVIRFLVFLTVFGIGYYWRAYTKEDMVIFTKISE